MSAPKYGIENIGVAYTDEIKNMFNGINCDWQIVNPTKY